jgi:hypothetical protein
MIRATVSYPSLAPQAMGIYSDAVGNDYCSFPVAMKDGISFNVVDNGSCFVPGAMGNGISSNARGSGSCSVSSTTGNGNGSGTNGRRLKAVTRQRRQKV